MLKSVYYYISQVSTHSFVFRKKSAVAVKHQRISRRRRRVEVKKALFKSQCHETYC